MGSIAPSGKLGADPTIMMVFGLMKRFMRWTSAWRVVGLTGTTCSLILKYCEAFQKAA